MLRSPSRDRASSAAQRASWGPGARTQLAHSGHHHQRDRQQARQDRVEDEPLECDWRQAAQMLTEHDQLLLLAADSTDVAPVRRHQLHGQPAGAGQAQRRAQTNKSPSSPGPKAVAGAHHQHQRLAGSSPANGDEPVDDNSSLSFAQSGCHSILSAWRIKAANKAARLAASATGRPKEHGRPVSVLSNASSAGKRSAASTAFTLASRAARSPAGQTRIPLGPRAAQHFVTNSRRRRRANELILSTLEARRRALALNRQHLGSLFGSDSYLAEAGQGQLAGPDGVGEPVHHLLVDDYQRLSLSPSPGGRSKTPDSGAGAQPGGRPALSDLGAGRAQRHRLLALAERKPAGRIQAPASPAARQRAAAGRKRPPLAKLDQNSSDLCSDNSSSADDSSSSDGSRFTQLVTSELAPDCVLLDEQVLESRLSRDQQQQARVAGHWQPVATSGGANIGHQPARLAPPRVPERTRRRRATPSGEADHQNESLHRAGGATDRLHQHQHQHQHQHHQLQQQAQEDTSRSSEDGTKLRRGALKRDSIRRMRLSRGQPKDKSQHQHQANQNDSCTSSDLPQSMSSDNGSSSSFRDRQAGHSGSAKPLSKARKLDIESNPFLNRHHFRTLSTRSDDSRQSTAAARRAGSASFDDQSCRASARQNRVGQQVVEARRSVESSASRTSPPEGRDKDNVRRVGQMLRNMQPNQVFTSSSCEISTSISKMTTRSSAGAPPGGSQQTEQPHVSKGSRPAAAAHHQYRPPTRLVKEATKSSDDLVFDASGNRHQLKLDELSRHERVEPTVLRDGSIFSQERVINERVQIMRQSAQSISPPAEFADSKAGGSGRRTAENRPERREQAPSLARAPLAGQSIKNRSAPEAPGAHTRTTASSESNRPTAAPGRPKSPVGPPRPAPSNTTTNSAPASQRAMADERVRPAVQARAVARQTPTGPGRQQRREPQPERVGIKPIDAVRILQASLPKFERTADDEFKKRVEELRQLARASLQDNPIVSSRRQTEHKQLTKPPSTNWIGASEPQLETSYGGGPPTKRPAELMSRPKPSGAGAESAQTSKPIGGRPMSPAPPTRPLATNLDEMLLADRYQRPLAGAWRRSNSSLASLGQTKAGQQQQQEDIKRAASPFGMPKQQQPASGSANGSLPNQSAMSAGPSGDPQANPVRLVVREKSAPRLDYAFVEQRVPVRHVRTVDELAEPPAPNQSVASPAGLRPQQQPQHGTTGGTSVRSTRVASPRSPEFGTLAASSNDDSAIASSVSSPSLSFMMNAAGEQQQQASQQRQLANQRVPTVNRSSSPSVGCRSAGQLVGLRPGASSTGGPRQDPGNSPATLQSILRRQQQQHLLALQAGDAPTAEQPKALQPEQQQANAPMATTNQQPEQVSPANRRPASPEVVQQQQKQQLVGQDVARPSTSQPQSSPPKRVHFNDRTSIRSFESISSLNSNSTAVPNSLIRQQIGSPDSMGSGSTSRLSVDSPDLRKSTGGAAIYAIRGDPELEIDQQQHPVGGDCRAPQMLAAIQPQMSHEQQWRNYAREPSPRPSLVPRQFGQVQQQQQQAVVVAPLQMHNQQRPFIRMTAPPSMNTNTVSPRPVAPFVTRAGQPMGHQMPQADQTLPVGRSAVINNEDEDDPDYALRLRQAATSRVFSYVQPQLLSAGQQQPAATRPAQVPSGGGSQTGPRRQPVANDLLNFQTEV